MRVYGRSLRMNNDRGASPDLIDSVRKVNIHKKNRENLSGGKNQGTPSVGVEPSFFKTEEKKPEDLGNLPSTSPAPAA
ncbi:MAG: hypothetical protein CFE62_002570 [Candidatus Aquirickettsiella gammari]|uniref:Uncharacterized protein n=1 Tax=Candidatus Aquirickettsiella gammari TaxID=2016198 RepID=A0A370CIH3_9COXI|nr:MAG: hypothetical protein CFE62_002570 [Candidatus Aquirickettsiella gammari]